MRSRVFSEIMLAIKILVIPGSVRTGSFNAALGVQCTFCHAQDRSSDEKGEKLMARKMITMTHEINEKNFNGKMEVRCFTCHKGAEHPVSEPPAAQ